MKIVYDGPQPSRTVEIGRGKQTTVKRGEPTEVPKEIGEQLIQQRHFSSSSAKTTTPAKTDKERE